MHKIFVQNKIFQANNGATLLDILRDNDIKIQALCGGNKKCGKCKVKITNCTFEKHPLISQEEHQNGICLACTIKVESDLHVEILGKTEKESFPSDKVDGTFNCAIDIGTTGVSINVYDLSGELFEEFHFSNPQISYGADVISRIKAWDDGNGENLTNSIRNAIKIRIAKFNIQKCYISANTTMLHILAGVSPSGIGRAPYVAEFLETKEISLKKLGLSESGTCVLLPSISAYIGADIVAGSIACELSNQENVLLLDLGTNGEMLLKTKHGFFGASTAAGPCFEGGNISCGTYFHENAITSVTIKNGKIFTPTKNPTGICGSGLIDAMRVMLDAECVDGYGSLNVLHESYEKNKGIKIAKNIYLTDKDIRNIQLAKSAICTGVQLLIKGAGIKESNIDKVLVAGAFSKGINFSSAGAIGLIPNSMIDKCTAVGNTSLKGSEICLFDSEKLALASIIAEETTVIDLAKNAEFASLYADNMIFENYE
ncbi:MAG: ASKHA domain-containing protein [Bacillota bacterium]